MFIEISGTPGSGKSSVITELRHRYTCQIIKPKYVGSFETEKVELTMLLSILGTLAAVNELRESNSYSSSRLIVIERGLFDRIAWARLLAMQNERYTQVAQDLEMALRESLSHIQVDLVVLALTSYDKVRSRRKSKYDQHPNRVFKVVNPHTIEKLNTIYSDLYTEFNDTIHIVKLDDLSQDLFFDQKLATVTYEIDQIRAKL